MPHRCVTVTGRASMVDQTPLYRSTDPDIEPCDDDLTNRRVAPYRFGQSAGTDYREDSVPLFLSDYDGEPDPSEYMPPLPRRKASISLRILAGVSATAGQGIL